MTIIPYYIITDHHEGHDEAECGYDDAATHDDALTGAENVDIGTQAHTGTGHPALTPQSDHLECNQVANI